MPHTPYTAGRTCKIHPKTQPPVSRGPLHIRYGMYLDSTTVVQVRGGVNNGRGQQRSRTWAGVNNGRNDSNKATLLATIAVAIEVPCPSTYPNSFVPALKNVFSSCCSAFGKVVGMSDPGAAMCTDWAPKLELANRAYSEVSPEPLSRALAAATQSVEVELLLPIKHGMFLGE